VGRCSILCAFTRVDARPTDAQVSRVPDEDFFTKKFIDGTTHDHAVNLQVRYACGEQIRLKHELKLWSDFNVRNREFIGRRLQKKEQ
jgi:hypothetical protein